MSQIFLCIPPTVASSSTEHDLHSNWVLKVPRVADGSTQPAVRDSAIEKVPKKKNQSGSTSSRLRLQRNPIHLPKVVESAFQTLRFKPKLKKQWSSMGIWNISPRHNAWTLLCSGVVFSKLLCEHLTFYLKKKIQKNHTLNEQNELGFPLWDTNPGHRDSETFFFYFCLTPFSAVAQEHKRYGLSFYIFLNKLTFSHLISVMNIRILTRRAWGLKMLHKEKRKDASSQRAFWAEQFKGNVQNCGSSVVLPDYS